MENGRDMRGRGSLPTARGGNGLGFPPFSAPRTEPAGGKKEQGPLAVPRVCLDTKSVRRQEAGADSAGERRVLYSVGLVGPVGERWRRAFRLVQIEDTGLFRYRLEMESATVSFTCLERNGGAKFAAGLRQLDLLVARVNQKAASLD